MTVQVIFFKAKGVGSVHSPGVGDITAREAVTIPATTSRAVADGEIVVVLNEETSAVLVAYGTTPDATATASTAATSAGYPVPAGLVSPPIVAPTGAKINVKDVP
jgi:hypothetical protein